MMGKKIKLTESQLYDLMEMGEPQVYEKHWYHMFERSVLVLFKMGHKPEILKEKIDEIFRRRESSEMGEQYGEANTTSSLNGSH
jgi:hypothetical protein